MDIIAGLVKILTAAALLSLRGFAWLLRLSWRGIKGLARWLRPRSGTHGTARWATWLELVRGGVWARGSGLVVAKAFGGFIRYRGDAGTIVYAPMGSGKGVGVVIPNLLEWPGSIICTDPKSENFAITGHFRETLGPVYRLDAMNPGSSARLNPFDGIRRGTYHEADDVSALTELLVASEASDAHWDTSAKQLLAMFIRFVLHTYPAPLCTLSTVHELLSLDGESRADLLAQMASCGVASVEAEARVTRAALEGRAEMTSVYKNTSKAMGFWAKDRIGGVLTSASDFSFLDMHRGTMTVYVIVPEDKLVVYKPFLRLMMGSAIAATVRGKEFPRPEHRPLLLFDECAALGRLEPLAYGMGYLREYANTLLVFQDLGQLIAHYGEETARTIVASCGCQVAFNVQDLATARELSDLLGPATILSRSQGASQANTELVRQNQQTGLAESGRPLRDPSEVIRMKPNRCLVRMPSQVMFPIMARKVRYYAERRWKGRWVPWRSKAPAGAVAAMPPELEALFKTEEWTPASPAYADAPAPAGAAAPAPYGAPVSGAARSGAPGSAP